MSAEVLARARRDAEIIDVGKTPDGHGPQQERINRLMVEEARRGRRVVRLKGGDPFVFGRGGEELEYLRRHGIAYEVVPGITAALACAAYAGIPLTHRDHARGLQIATAHCRASLDCVDWHGLARPGQTLAFYMGIAELEAIGARLTAAGLAPGTPAALVENGARAGQRVLVSDLASIPEAARRHAIGAPAMLFIGEVAARAAQLDWYGAAPIVQRSPPAAARRPPRRPSLPLTAPARADVGRSAPCTRRTARPEIRVGYDITAGEQ